MPKKDISGDKNPFYGKKHSEESKKKMGGAARDYSGSKNPFYGKKHKKESLDSMKEKLSSIFSGEKNPFYGMEHTNDSINKIIEKNKEFREKNKELILQRQLDRLGLSKDKISDAFAEYKNTFKNADDIAAFLDVDKRVFFKYVKDLNIATEEDIKFIKDKKRMGRSRSSPELKLNSIFIEKYGIENVKWSFRLEKYFYDFLLFDSLFVEYDGYYWHTYFKTNDEEKNKLAEKVGKKIYRIKEEQNRKADIDFHLKQIDGVLNGLKIEKNRKEGV